LVRSAPFDKLAHQHRPKANCLLGAESWRRVPVSHIEDLRDAVYGAGLEATQMSRGRLEGSLLFATAGDVLYSSGLIGGRVALTGPLSQDRVTLGIGLAMAPGTRHWLNEVSSGAVGVFLAGDEHDALYTPGSIYATATLTFERLEDIAAQAGLVLDARALGGTGIAAPRFAERDLARLQTLFLAAHGEARGRPAAPASLGAQMLDMIIARLGRAPHVNPGPAERPGLARIVGRARAYIHANLDRPLSIDAIAAAAFTSRRTLHRAFESVLDETPYSYAQRLRLHRIRRELVSDDEKCCTITAVANQWGMGELGRFAGWYRELFGERPSDTLRRQREAAGAPHLSDLRLARSA
jgi:AraC-like DNA-binding protein